MQKIFLLALAGGMGTLARYSVSIFMNKMVSHPFPLGTFVVNVLGSFLIGFLWEFFNKHSHIPTDIQIIILVGFMGAFTTFSSFMLETKHLPLTHAFFNIIGQNILGFSALIIGIKLASLFV